MSKKVLEGARSVSQPAEGPATLRIRGDDDQLIHGWRHADPAHILRFEERHPASARIVLGRNFRSRAEILDAAVAA